MTIMREELRRALVIWSPMGQPSVTCPLPVKSVNATLSKVGDAVELGRMTRVTIFDPKYYLAIT